MPTYMYEVFSKRKNGMQLKAPPGGGDYRYRGNPMLALVKKPHIEIRGDIPEQLLTFIRDYFGKESVEIVPDDEEQLSPESSSWYAETKVRPGEALRIYREIHGMTQAVLGAKLGGIDRHEISKMEIGKRNISVKTAKRLSKLFRVSVERFL